MTALARGWLLAYPSRPDAPLILSGPTLADALGMPPRPKPPVLPERLAVLLPLLAADLTARQIGQRLHLSEHTVKNRLKDLYAALGVRNRIGAVTGAMTCGLLSEPGRTP